MPAAAVRAGLKIRLVDVDPETLDFDDDSLERCDWGRVAALVTHNLFGLPNETKRLERLAEREGFLLIDDAAQAFGARRGGRAAGSAGDADAQGARAHGAGEVHIRGTSACPW